MRKSARRAPRNSSKNSSKNEHASREKLAHILAHVGHFLPDQGPISVFVHHNTLHAYEELGFHKAITRATQEMGAEGYMTEAAFHECLVNGRIRKLDIDAVLEAEGVSTNMTLLGGLLSKRMLYRIVLQHPVHAETEAGLSFLIEERRHLTQLPEDLEAGARKAIVSEGTAYLQEMLKIGDAKDVARVLVGEDDEHLADETCRREFGVAFDLEALNRAIAEDPERFVVRALFTACQRIGRRDLRLPESKSFTLGKDGTHRELLLGLTGIDTNEFVNPTMIRASAAYLDQGMAYWPMPNRERGFYAVIRDLVGGSSDGPAAWLDGVSKAFRKQAADKLDALGAIAVLLGELGISEGETEHYLRVVTQQLPGWSGMFARLERNPGDRPADAPPATLADFLAVRLTYEMQAIRHVAAQALDYRERISGLAKKYKSIPLTRRAPGDHDGPHRLFLVCQRAGISAAALEELSKSDGAAVLDALDAFTPTERRRLLCEAYEHRYRHQILSALKTVRPRAKVTTKKALRFQAVFCIDDREESLRRHLEELSSDIETFGAAGFFGLAMDFVSLDDPRPAALCPVVVTPAHVVKEEPIPEDAPLYESRLARRRWMSAILHNTSVGSRSLVRGTFLTMLTGGIAALPMLGRILFPRLTAKFEQAFQKKVLPEPRTVFRSLRDDPDAKHGSKHAGFTIDEAADRIKGLLAGMGKVDKFGRLFAIIGHGAASINNPHESAYSCGACGGRRGFPNARLFASLANDPRIRKALVSRGVEIPSTTWFIGGYHDTTNDTIPFLDEDEVPASHAEDLKELRRLLDIARAKNAHERTRRFESAPVTDDPEVSLIHVEGRAESLAEPRPEYNHATNAICMVGRRCFTKGLFLDRRSFLVSYDPTIDPDGKILERTLTAVGPVGAGISLEYYFSYVDNEIYGCGTKLPHNIAGYLGVMSGHSSDLRTGLSRQMVEIHEPMRLLTIVEATPETLLAIAARVPVVKTLVVGRWMQLVSMDPDTGRFQEFTDKGFVPIDPTPEMLASVGSSVEWYKGKLGHLPPARIELKSHKPAREGIAHAA